MKRGLLAHVRRHLLRGLFLVLPLVVTLWLLGLVYGLVQASVTPLVMDLFVRIDVPGLERWIVRNGLLPLIGVLLTATLIYLLGVMAGNLVGRRILGRVEGAILRIPLVKGVYGAARQLLNAFSATSQRSFSRVVVIEYPRAGLWTIGFVTSEARHRIPHGERDRETQSVFLPTTPNPTSGWMLLVPRDEMLELDMPIDEAVKLIVSGGIVSPDDLGPMVKRRDASDANV
jgi:uncharacterized membrane protein